MSKQRILISVPSRHHVEIALDELIGLKEEGYICEQFPYAAKDGAQSKLRRLWIIIKNSFNLVKIARGFRPDIIYLNSRLEVLASMRDFITILTFKCCYFPKVKFIIKSHGSDIDVLDRRDFLMSRIVLPYLRENISAWLFLSREEVAKIAEKRYFREQALHVTKNIVRTQQFIPDSSFKNRHKIADDQKILLFVGRLITDKGIVDVLEAFDRISKIYTCVLIVVGDGAEMGRVKKILAQYNLAERVILTGFIPENDVVDYYANSDILVFPTYFPEGFPMALFNSVAAGLAIITTQTRAATDYLSEPENCLWVKPKDSGSVFSALERLLGSQELMDSMRGNNVGKAAMFSKQRVARELGDIIQMVCKNEIYDPVIEKNP